MQITKNKKMIRPLMVFTIFLVLTIEMTGIGECASLYADNFYLADNWHINKWTSVSGEWVPDNTLQSDAGHIDYLQKEASPQWHWTYTGDSYWQDYEAEVRLEEFAIDGVQGNPAGKAGLRVRLHNPRNYYHVYLSSDNKIYLDKVLNGTAISLSNTSFTWYKNTWYTLKVKVQGANIKVYVNGVEKISYTDGTNPITTGKIALTSYNGLHKYNNVSVVNAEANAPVLSNIRAINTNSYSTTINWETDADSSSQVKYWITSQGESTALLTNIINEMVRNHFVSIINLTANSGYSYRVISQNAAATTTSSIYTFNAPAFVSNPQDNNKHTFTLFYYDHPNLSQPWKDYPTHRPFQEGWTFGCTDTKWYEQELMYMEEAQIDVILPVYSGDTAEYSNEGLNKLCQAERNLRAQGYKPPKIALCIPGSAIDKVAKLNRVNAWNYKPVDLNYDSSQPNKVSNVLSHTYKIIRDFYQRVPEDLVFKYGDKYPVYVQWPSHSDCSIYADNSFTTYLKDRFKNDFNSREPYFVLDSRWYHFRNSSDTSSPDYSVHQSTVDVTNGDNYWVADAALKGLVKTPDSYTTGYSAPFVIGGAGPGWDGCGNASLTQAWVSPASGEDPTIKRMKKFRTRDIDGINNYENDWNTIIGWNPAAQWVVIDSWNLYCEGSEITPTKEFQYDYIKKTHDKVITWRGAITRTAVQPSGDIKRYLLGEDRYALEIKSDSHLASYGLTPSQVTAVDADYLAGNGYIINGTAAKWFVQPSDSGAVYLMSTDANASTAYLVFSMDHRYVLGGWSNSAIQVVTPTWFQDNGKTVADFYETPLLPGDIITAGNYLKSDPTTSYWGEQFPTRAFDHRMDNGKLGWKAIGYGNRYLTWVSPQVPTTGSPAWLQIKLACPSSVSRIIIDDRLALPAPQDFSVMYSNDGQTWYDFNNVYKSADDSNWSGISGGLRITGNTDGKLYFKFTGVTVNYIKYTVTKEGGDNWASLGELTIE